MHACKATCTRAHATCTLAQRRARLHVAHACLQNGVLACTWHMHACRTACMLARGTCMLAERRAYLHVAHAPLQSGMQPGTAPCILASAGSGQPNRPRATNTPKPPTK